MIAKAVLANFVILTTVIDSIYWYCEAVKLIRSFLDNSDDQSSDPGDSDDTSSTHSFTSAMSEAASFSSCDSASSVDSLLDAAPGEPDFVEQPAWKGTRQADRSFCDVRFRHDSGTIYEVGGGGPNQHVIDFEEYGADVDWDKSAVSALKAIARGRRQACLVHEGESPDTNWSINDAHPSVVIRSA